MRKEKDLPVNIQCRFLAFTAARLAAEIFAEEDAPPFDGRVVANKERALERALDQIEKLSGVNKEKFWQFPRNILWPAAKYLEAFRGVGVPIATDKEYEIYCRERLAAHKE